MNTIVPPATDAQDASAPWTDEGVAFLRRVAAGEVYTGVSGTALARWAVGVDRILHERPHDRGDLARCMNVYWSAPESLRPKMQGVITMWAERLRNEADGQIGWRFAGMPDFTTPRQLSRYRGTLDEYWGVA